MSRRTQAAAIMMSATVLTGCAASSARSSLSPTTGAATRGTPSPALASPSASVSRTGSGRSDLDVLIEGMSVEEKVGQLFMPVVYGPAADGGRKENQAQFGVATPAQVIGKYRPGGVILFPWAGNVSGVGQLVGLVNGMQKASPKIPLLVGADQENGVVSRLGTLVTKLPGAKTIGDTGDPREARAAARVTGEELRALGLNLDFAPVADVNINPRNPIIGTRAYGSDPRKVAKMVGAAVDGFHDAGVAATAKHFPGHGDTTVDSHTGLPVIKHSRSEWEKLDAPPFREAIASGVDAIMSAHLEMPKLDKSGDPATLSKPILTGLLREKLGFDGVVVTDSLQMQGVREKYGDGEVAVRAILAGADILLMPPDFAKAYGAVLAAAKSGRVPAERLDQSVTRILRLKTTRGLFGAKPADPAEAAKILKSEEHRRVARRISGHSA
jgi:beta-N-acetylhexosaminidase